MQDSFISTGDTIRGGGIEDLAYLLSLGIRVALIYGDADYICNWFGGEAVSLAIAAQLQNYSSPSTTTTSVTIAAFATSVTSPASYATAFPAAGYADIVVNASYVGGQVRQYGNLSFSRIYDSGHFVPYFQPETAFTVFTRVLQGADISTGDIVDLSTFGTTGPANSTHTNVAPAAPSQTCWVRAFNSTCSNDDLNAMLDGKGLVANGIFYQDSGSVSLPSSSVTAGVPGQPVSTSSTPQQSDGGSVSVAGSYSTELTGVYTATNTPMPSHSSSAAAVEVPGGTQVVPAAAVLAGVAIGVFVML